MALDRQPGPSLEDRQVPGKAGPTYILQHGLVFDRGTQREELWVEPEVLGG